MALSKLGRVVALHNVRHPLMTRLQSLPLAAAGCPRNQICPISGAGARVALLIVEIPATGEDCPPPPTLCFCFFQDLSRLAPSYFSLMPLNLSLPRRNVSDYQRQGRWLSDLAV